MGAAASFGDGKSFELLKKQDAETSAAIIQVLSGNDVFEAYAKAEADLIVQRDNEDAEKLQAGIQVAAPFAPTHNTPRPPSTPPRPFGLGHCTTILISLRKSQISIDAGVLPVLNPPPQYVEIDVIGKSPDDVCNVITTHLGDAANTGCVIVLCGLSGTGKGTTMAKLNSILPNTITWSNGNVFR